MCSRHNFTLDEVNLLRRQLLSWYDENQRDLPWRRISSEPDPNVRGYSVWVSEVMLQQTQVKTVVEYYRRWMKRWPSIFALANASLEEVNSLWSGLGYYSRARMLHHGAKKLITKYDGQLPRSAESLKATLPGVGRYTANAIASIAFNERVPVLDGNVIRVLTRLREIGSAVQLTSTANMLWDLTERLVDPERPGDFNQALMELGAVCCTAKQPKCLECPLGVVGVCGAYNTVKCNSGTALNCKEPISVKNECKVIDDVEDCCTCISQMSFDPNLGVTNYPVKLAKKPARAETTLVLIVYYCLLDELHLLLFQRPKKGLLAGLWEFPSRVLAPTETTASGLVGGLGKLDLSALVDRVKIAFDHSCAAEAEWNPVYIGQVTHLFSHIRMTYVVYSLELPTKSERLLSPSVGRWISLSAFESAPVSTATRKMLAYFQTHSTAVFPDKLKTRNRLVRTKRHSGKATDAKQLRLDKFLE